MNAPIFIAPKTVRNPNREPVLRMDEIGRRKALLPVSSADVFTNADFTELPWLSEVGGPRCFDPAGNRR
jgi:hypothetical protein